MCPETPAVPRNRRGTKPGAPAARPAASPQRARRGERTREAILRRAVELASLEGLEGLTIGRLAAALSMSKSGLFAHFSSKEHLQCATVDTAREIFRKAVVYPSAGSRGLVRLRRLCRSWLAYAERGIFPGGCFFSAASLEFDDRPGLVRDHIAEVMRGWLRLLAETVREAQQAGEIKRSVDPNQLAFEIQALAMGGNWGSRLFHDRNTFRKAWKAIQARLAEVSTKS